MNPPDPGRLPDSRRGLSSDAFDAMRRIVHGPPDPSLDSETTCPLPPAARASPKNEAEQQRQEGGGLSGWKPPSVAEMAAELPGYEVESLIGRGGMGAVYKGVQRSLDRPVAIKVLPREIAADSTFLARFKREAQTLGRLHHPGIVTVYDSGQSPGGYLWFAMEFVNGTTLQQLVFSNKRLPPAQALDIVRALCDALKYAHDQGVIHRDIKPANVLITTEGQPRLADFGLSRPAEESGTGMTRTNIAMGTPDYAAPEQMAGKADRRSDLYALGVMFYEMLTGHLPKGSWEPPSDQAQVDPKVDEIIQKALQREPGRRYQQVSELSDDLGKVRRTTTRLTAAIETAEGMWSRVRQRKRTAAAAMLGLALAGWWLISKGDPFDRLWLESHHDAGLFVAKLAAAGHKLEKIEAELAERSASTAEELSDGFSALHEHSRSRGLFRDADRLVENFKTMGAEAAWLVSAQAADDSGDKELAAFEYFHLWLKWKNPAADRWIKKNIIQPWLAPPDRFVSSNDMLSFEVSKSLDGLRWERILWAALQKLLSEESLGNRAAIFGEWLAVERNFWGQESRNWIAWVKPVADFCNQSGIEEEGERLMQEVLDREFTRVSALGSKNREEAASQMHTLAAEPQSKERSVAWLHENLTAQLATAKPRHVIDPLLLEETIEVPPEQWVAGGKVRLESLDPPRYFRLPDVLPSLVDAKKQETPDGTSARSGGDQPPVEPGQQPAMTTPPQSNPGGSSTANPPVPDTMAKTLVAADRGLIFRWIPSAGVWRTDPDVLRGKAKPEAIVREIEKKFRDNLMIPPSYGLSLEADGSVSIAPISK